MRGDEWRIGIRRGIWRGRHEWQYGGKSWEADGVVTWRKLKGRGGDGV